MTVGERLKRRRKELGMSAEAVAEKLGCSPSTVYRYENGEINKMGIDKLKPIAEAINTSPAYLMGWEDEETLPANVSRIEPMQRIPLVGQIACGIPILAEQNIEDYVDLPGHIRADFALTCKGESMIGAGIRSGDIVYIRKQEEVENGQIAAVMVGGDEATLKRVYTKPGVVQLVAENPNIAPAVFIGKEAEQIHIIGLAVAYTHVLDWWPNLVPPPPRAAEKYITEEITMKKRVAIILFGSLLAMSLCACSGDDTASTDQGETADTTTTEETQEPADTSSATVGDYEVSIGDAGMISDDYTGEEAFLVNLTFTNNSDETTSPMLALMVEAYQDGVQLERAIIGSEDFDAGSESLNVQPGGSNEFQLVFTLTSESPVQVIAQEFLGDGTQATKTFDPTTLA